jgi:hypothetical protein
MHSNSFVYWLNGFFELSGATTLDEKQVKIIKEHIAMTLTKVTPTSYQSPVTIPPFGVERTIKNMGRDAYVQEQIRLFPGVICGSCGKTCSEEGGTCKICQKNEYFKTVPAENILNLTTHLCTECVVICPNSRKIEDHIGRTCPLCKVYCKNLEAKDLPIINVPTHLSC